MTLAPHDDLLAVTDGNGGLYDEVTVDRPSQSWLSDISEHPTQEIKLYLCAIEDV